jgi:hypothetical protein
MANFDATKSSSTANSYATTSEADDFFEFQYGAEEWSDISDDDKERLLATATAMIDRLKPKYEKLDDSQSLNFPMENTDDSDEDGFDEAKKACIIQALYLYKNNDAIAEAKQAALQGLKSESLGKVSRATSGLNPFYTFDPAALQNLKGFVDLSLKVSR